MTAVSREPVPETLEGHYAGAATRLGAYVIDAFLSVALYGLLLALVVLIWELVSRDDLSTPAQNTIPYLVGLVVWVFVYWWGSTALWGKTVGKAVIGVRIVRRGGTDLDPLHALWRVLAFPLSFLVFGLGFVGIVVGREHRALHDVIADTAVVYDWAARTPRLRLLDLRRNVPGESSSS